MRCLTVVYDPTCGLCTRLGYWLSTQPKWIAIRLLPSSEAGRAYPALAGRSDELIGVSETGAVYFGDHAWLICLYALKNYRHWAERLSRPALLPLARQAFSVLSANRHRISLWLGRLSDPYLESELKSINVPRCHGTNPYQPSA